MELKDFIGKTVIATARNQRMFITSITAPEIEAQTTEPEPNGYYGCYSWETINGDPISNGYLVFEDPALKEPFIEAFEAYCRTKDAYWETYGYWMMRE